MVACVRWVCEWFVLVYKWCVSARMTMIMGKGTLGILDDGCVTERRCSRKYIAYGSSNVQ